MTRVNAREEFGIDLDLSRDLEPVRPAICDARMMPHEWLISEGGRLLKTDGASHGDDHFFPGPCDIAWDLAGAIVEWELPAQAAEFLCERYRRLTGDDAQPRLNAHLLAYSLFRLGFCLMAANAVAGSEEESRLRVAHQRYRRWAEQALGRRGPGLTLAHQISGKKSKNASRLVCNCFSMSFLLPSSTCMVTCASRPFFSWIVASPTCVTSSAGSSLMP
jgi:hypothetical protein